MSTQATSVEIMGKCYQIKCPESEVDHLKEAAKYLEEKMNSLREAGIFNMEKTIIITALNLAHQYLALSSHFEHQKMEQLSSVAERLHQLADKLDSALLMQQPQG